MLVLVSHSHDKTSGLCVEMERCWTLARAGLEEARLVNLARQSSVFLVLWQAIPVMIRLQRTSRRRRSRRALQVCLS